MCDEVTAMCPWPRAMLCPSTVVLLGALSSLQVAASGTSSHIHQGIVTQNTKEGATKSDKLVR